MKLVRDLKTKIFADGADKAGMLEMYKNPVVSGFTTNPSLMRKAGVTNYEAFAQEIIAAIPDRSISFEVFSDDFDSMYAQALTIGSWGEHVYVKIPVTNTKAESTMQLIRELAQQKIKMNVTAILTLDQVDEVVDALKEAPSSYISVFAGRIADTGRDPLPVMQKAVEMMSPYSQLELIWASPREVLNIFQADDIGCHIITVTNEMIKKLGLVGKDLTLYSLETVNMFYQDATAAGFNITPALSNAEAANM
jgi:transaldolase